MNNIYRLLKLQDNFSTHFQILFKGERKLHSIYSIVISLLINIGCFIMGFTLLLDLIQHKKPIVNIVKLSNTLTTNMTLNTKDLLYTIGLRNKYYQNLIDPTIVSLIPTYERMYAKDGELIQEVINLDIINCTNIYPLFEEVGVGDKFNSTGLKNDNCFNGTKLNEEIVLGGKYGTDFYGNIAVYVKKCVNDTPGLICKSDEVINEAVQGGWLQITYVNSYVDFTNYSTPIQYTTQGFYTNLDVDLNKVVYNYFNPVYFNSENNIIFSNEKTQRVIKFDYQITDINLAQKKTGIIYTVYVCPSFTVEKYYRRYVKIQDIGASIGGFWSGLNIFGIILLTYVQLQHLRMKIANSLFTFVCDYPLVHCPLFDDITNMKNCKRIPYNPHNLNKKRYYHINLGISNIFRIFVCYCSRASVDLRRKYEEVQREVLKYIDFTKASQLFQDVDNIKTLLLLTNKATPRFINEKRTYNLSDHNPHPIDSLIYNHSSFKELLHFNHTTSKKL